MSAHDTSTAYPLPADAATLAYEFKKKWSAGGAAYELNERQGAQTYFLDLCALLGVPAPGTQDGYVFEKQTLALGQMRGFADVFYKGRFAWENKAPGKNLDAALRQLLGYSLALDNPPLLVVCDRLEIRIHTQFTGYPSVTYSVKLADLTDPTQLQLLRRLWLDPESFRPKQTNRDITELAAKSFATLADQLRRRGPQEQPQREAYAEQVAHFLTQALFCFFAEDVGLLPGKMFERMVGNRHLNSQQLTDGLHNLFTTMRTGGLFGADHIPWFNGGLFKTVQVPKLEILDITELRNAASLNWSAIDVSIFGTLFERGLDPSKRSQLGAHYTDPATIERIIHPVVRRPLLQKWELLAQEIRGLLAKSTKKGDANYRKAQDQYISFLQSLADFKILDPACGSGNFLFLGLKALKDIEHQIIIEAELLGLERPVDLCTSPANMLGIELNEYAAELARVTVWIGELQWRMEHGYPFKDNPILEPLDCIEQRDALVTQLPPTVEGQAPQYVEADWPQVSVVIGNPPFLGDKRMRSEMGDDYVEALRKTYAGRVPGGADLVCYWFEKARKAIETKGLGAAGLVSTQSIRAGANRKVLSAINKTTRIFEAWSDETWVNDGAAVRVSLVAFGWGECCFLNGERVKAITADLANSDLGDLTSAAELPENRFIAFQGPVKVGAFDIPGQLARQWLAMPNVNSQSSASILRPWANGQDIARRPSDTWIIDFGASMSQSDAALFETAFSYIEKIVKPMRMGGNRQKRKDQWWLHGETVPGLRLQTKSISRYIVTPRVAKHRYFVRLASQVWPDSRLYAIARADDTSFGILSSRIHEVWSLAQASIHGDGDEGGRPTYNAKSCFETFPFPAGLTPADTAHQRVEVLASGATIPEGIYALNTPVVHVSTAQAATKNIVKKTSKRAAATALSAPTAPHTATAVSIPVAANATLASMSNTKLPAIELRAAAIAIAEAAKRLDDLRQAWLNPPEWTQGVPEVVPLGMTTSPYPDRILPRNNLSEEDAAALQKRTLTNLYNLRQTGQAHWLSTAHQQLDAAVATAYGWADYTHDMPDDTILQRLLALNLERSA
jgi:hypothetical protein